MYLVDLPGYGYAKVSEKERAQWGKLIEGYLMVPDSSKQCSFSSISGTSRRQMTK